MNPAETSARASGPRVTPFVSGFGVSLCAVYLLARFELGPYPPLCVPGIALASLLAAWGLGAFVARRSGPAAVRWGLAASAALVWLFWLAVPFGATEGDLPLAVAGMALLAGTGFAAWRREVPLWCGLACGMLASAAGLPAAVGLGPLVVTGVVLVIGAALLSRMPCFGAPPESDSAPPPARLLLAAAVGAGGAMLLRNYLPATRSLVYAGAELGVAFAIGCVVGRAVLGAAQESLGGRLAMACGVGLIGAMSGGAFFLFPDLIWSGSGAMQLPAEMLTPGRLFPMWILAFGLGAASAPAMAGAPAGALLAAGAGAVASGLLGVSYSAPLLLTLSLCLLYAAAVGLRRAHAGKRRVLRWGSVAFIAALLTWAVAGDTWAGYPGLRERMKACLEEHVRRGAWPSILRAESVGSGQRVVLSGDGVRGGFLNGALVSVSRAGAPSGEQLRLLVALGLTYGEAPSSVGMVEPALPGVSEGAKLLARGVSVRPLLPRGSERCDVIICGPGPLSGAGNPMQILSLEGLQGLRRRLSSGGVVAVWIPAGTTELPELRRCLATFQEAFSRFDLFAHGRAAVVVAGGGQRLSYGRLAGAFKHPAAGQWLEEGGYWEPVEMLNDFVAHSGELSALIGGAEPYRLARPVRPPATARDLTARGNAVAMAAMLQHRAAGPGSLLERTVFGSERERFIALRGFEGLYKDRSRDVFRGLGQDYPAQSKRLAAFLQSSLARRDLLLGREKGGTTELAEVLGVFGLHEEAIQVLNRAVRRGRDSFEIRMALVEVLADAERPGEALPHCRRALEVRPDSVEMRHRLAALLLATGKTGEAAEALEELIEREAHSELDVLMLARLRLQMREYAEAARLARRVLERQPDNDQARLLLQLATGQLRGGT